MANEQIEYAMPIYEKYKIYLAHNFSAREWLRDEVAPRLKDEGFEIASRWIDDLAGDDVSNAQNDLIDVMRSDWFILFAEQHGDRPGRGKFIELGLAIAHRLRIIVIGPKSDDCIFYHLPQVERYDTLEEFLDE
jgi:hypothetical protein